MNDKDLCQLCADSYSPGQHGDVIERGNALVEVIKDGGNYIGVFQGSNDLKDWFYDLDAHKVDYSRGGLVHKGFYLDWLKLKGDLDKFDKPFIWTGHSLGHGLAIHAATDNPGRTIKVVTFGGPRVGNRRFNKLINFPLIRYQNLFDPVPFVPTLLMGFRHPNNPIWFNGEKWGRLTLTHWLKAALESEGFFNFGASVFESHMIDEYLQAFQQVRP